MAPSCLDCYKNMAIRSESTCEKREARFERAHSHILLKRLANLIGGPNSLSGIVSKSYRGGRGGAGPIPSRAIRPAFFTANEHTKSVAVLNRDANNGIVNLPPTMAH